MQSSKSGEEFTEEETARRRDEVIRRMAHTPPQPRVSPKAPAKAAKESAADPGLSRSRRGRAAPGASSAQD